MLAGSIIINCLILSSCDVSWLQRTGHKVLKIGLIPPNPEQSKHLETATVSHSGHGATTESNDTISKTVTIVNAVGDY